MFYLCLLVVESSNLSRVVDRQTKTDLMLHILQPPCKENFFRIFVPDAKSKVSETCPFFVFVQISPRHLREMAVSCKIAFSNFCYECHPILKGAEVQF